MPTQLKVLRGNPGKRPLNQHEPQPAVPDRMPPAPRHLTPAAKREWRRIVKVLLSAGLYTEVDHGLLEGYCQAYGRWVEAEEQVAKFGTVIKKSNGDLALSPYLGIANRALQQMQRFAVEFGMSPSSRSRVTAGEAPAKQDDPWAQLDRMGS